MDVFIREFAEALVERIEDRFGLAMAWFIAAIIILLLTGGLIVVGVLTFT